MSSASLDELGLLPSGQVPSNKRVNLTGRPGTRLAVSAPPHISSKGLGQGARPSRPAGYAQRYAAKKRSSHAEAHDAAPADQSTLNPTGVLLDYGRGQTLDLLMDAKE